MRSAAILSLLVAAVVVGGLPVGASEIHQAAARGDISGVERLITANPALVNARDRDGATPLHWAVDRGQRLVAETLLAYDADVNARKPNGVTPLHIAAALGRKELAELLIADGADVNATDRLGRTPLFLAQVSDRKPLVDLLLAHKAVCRAGSAVKSGPTPARGGPATGREAVLFERAVVRGLPVNMVLVNLSDPGVRFTAAVAKDGIGGSESFGSFVQRLQPTAAINGTFFSKATWVPIGDIVVDGRLVHFGGMGTGLCITGDNRASFVPVQHGRHTDWSGYQTVICCGPRLLADGAVVVDPQREGFRDSHVLGRGRRTAVGLTRLNRLLLLNTEKACSLQELAGIMQELGCSDAVNFDGGASTAMHYRGRTITSPGRPLTNVLCVYDRRG